MDIVMFSIENLAHNLDSLTESFLINLGIWGALISCLLIVIESILPVLPVCVFITLEFLTFGNIFGFIVSWICTCLGCVLSFFLFRTKVKKWFQDHFMKKDHKKINNFMKYVDRISVSGLAILVAIPFTPASVVNVAAGLSNISFKKFITGILIGKLAMVYFWGYIGTTLIECLTHSIYLLRIGILLLIAFILSKIANHYFELD